MITKKELTHAIRLDDRPIFVIERLAILIEDRRRLEIGRPFEIIDEALLPQLFDRIGDRRAFADVGLIREFVKMDTEVRQIFLDLGHFGVDAIGNEEIVGFLRILKVLIAKFVFDGLGNGDDVFAMGRYLESFSLHDYDLYDALGRIDGFSEKLM